MKCGALTTKITLMSSKILTTFKIKRTSTTQDPPTFMMMSSKNNLISDTLTIDPNLASTRLILQSRINLFSSCSVTLSVSLDFWSLQSSRDTLQSLATVMTSRPSGISFRRSSSSTWWPLCSSFTSVSVCSKCRAWTNLRRLVHSIGLEYITISSSLVLSFSTSIIRTISMKRNMVVKMLTMVMFKPLWNSSNFSFPASWRRSSSTTCQFCPPTREDVIKTTPNGRKVAKTQLPNRKSWMNSTRARDLTIIRKLIKTNSERLTHKICTSIASSEESKKFNIIVIFQIS